jgi:hypothetical protein
MISDGRYLYLIAKRKDKQQQSQLSAVPQSSPPPQQQQQQQTLQQSSFSFLHSEVSQSSEYGTIPDIQISSQVFFLTNNPLFLIFDETFPLNDTLHFRL